MCIVRSSFVHKSLVFILHLVHLTLLAFFFFFSSRRRHTRFKCDWSSDVCSSDWLENAKKIVPTAATYLDHRRLLDDKSIDAVLIATPQHLHCEHFVHSMQAGKHVYQEKTMAFNVDHAKRMRAAYRATNGKLTVQVGHQSCSSGQMTDAQAFPATGHPV